MNLKYCYYSTLNLSIYLEKEGNLFKLSLGMGNI